MTVYCNVCNTGGWGGWHAPECPNDNPQHELQKFLATPDATMDTDERNADLPNAKKQRTTEAMEQRMQKLTLDT